MNTPTPTSPILTAGSTVEITKGMRAAWTGKRYEDVRVRDRWTVESATPSTEAGDHLTVVLARGTARLRLYAAQAARTRVAAAPPAWMFALFGGLLIAASRLRPLRPAAIAVTLLSDLGFLLLALGSPLSPALERVAYFDGLSISLLLIAAVHVGLQRGVAA